MPNLTLYLDSELAKRRNREPKTSLKTKRKRQIIRRDGACLKCGSKENLTVDHIVSLFMGGSNNWGNLQTLCKSCNVEKGYHYADYRTEKQNSYPFDDE